MLFELARETVNKFLTETDSYIKPWFFNKLNCISLLLNFSECISRLINRDSTELLMEMEDPSDPSLSLLSSSKNHVSRDATNIIPPPSNLQDPVIKWPDTISDSSKKNSKFDLCALCVLLHVQTRMYVFLI